MNILVPCIPSVLSINSVKIAERALKIDPILTVSGCGLLLERHLF